MNIVLIIGSFCTINYKMNKNYSGSSILHKYKGLECICIPGIDVSYTKQHIAKVFEKVGVIKYIAEIPLKTNNHLKRVIIYISPNHSSPEYHFVKERFNTGLGVKIFYAGDIGEKPLFWNIAQFDNRSGKFVESYIQKF